MIGSSKKKRFIGGGRTTLRPHERPRIAREKDIDPRENRERKPS
jgi:hypothetical protein